MTGALIAILIVTLIAPLLAKVTRQYGFLRAGLDGFVLMTVIGLVVLVLIPDAMLHKGEWAVVLVLVGFFLPAFVEFVAHQYEDRFGDCHRAQQRTHQIVLIISAFAIIFHAMTDGAILALAGAEYSSNFLNIGVVAHRAGIAITLWWLLQPYIAKTTSYLMLILFALMTYFGYVMGGSVTSFLEPSFSGYWQAFAAGSLLHVVMHPLRERQIPKNIILAAHRVGTSVAIIFIMFSIYSTMELSTNPTLNTHIVSASKEALSHQGMAESLYIMQQAGILAAPWLLIMLVVGGIIRARRSLSVRSFFKEGASFAPMSFFVWLVAAAAYSFFYPHITHENLQALSINVTGVFYFWLTLVGISLLVKGAPTFFAAMLPDFLSHQHSHDH